MDGTYNPGWIYRSSRTAPPPRCPPAAHWNNPVPFRSSLSLYSRPLLCYLAPTSHRLPPSISFSHRVFPPSIFSVCRCLPLLRSFDRLSFSTPFADSSFDPLFTVAEFLSSFLFFLPPFSLFFSYAPLSFSIGLIAFHVYLRRTSNCTAVIRPLFSSDTSCSLLPS